MATRLPAVVVTGALCLAVSACSSDADTSSSESTAPPSVAGDTRAPTTTIPAAESTEPSVPSSASSGAPTTPPGPEGDATEGPIDARQAIAFAVADTPGDAISIEATTEHDVAAWEVVVLKADGTGVEYLVSIATGEFLEIKPTATAVISAPPVTLVQAIETATSAVPGSVVIEADLDTERGRVVWDVLVGQPGGGDTVEFAIDAETGEIVKQEVDD